MRRLILGILLLAWCAHAQSPADWNQPFPPHRQISNIYFVGTGGLSSHLITTPQGHILINSGFENTVPLIRDSVEKLGFWLSDIKILLSSHAHSDHVAGHALMKELTGVQVMATEADAAVISAGGPNGWRGCKVDRTLRDGDEVKLGGMTLVAHLTPGHTKGCTTWTTVVEEDGEKYNVVYSGSITINPGGRLVNNPDYPNIAEDFARTFQILKGLKCDVYLAPHGSQYGMEEKFRKLRAGVKPNPFIDPAGYRAYVAEGEKRYQEQLGRERGQVKSQ